MKLKAYLSKPPLLSKPINGDDMYSYIAISDCAVSAALIREDSREQKPVYYISKTLLETETRYQKMEKLILVLVIVARKLRLYFQSFRVVCMIVYPLMSILHNPDALYRVTKWTIELG